jgi:transcription initiation factor TFIIF subunit beta
MPQNELLDLIYNCFKRYNYWPLKSLKAELNQPENYLKQTLEMVAQLVKAGPHANTWQEARISTYADARSYDEVKDEVAPDSGFGLDGASDFGEVLGTDDEDEVKMEDVFPA